MAVATLERRSGRSGQATAVAVREAALPWAPAALPWAKPALPWAQIEERLTRLAAMAIQAGTWLGIRLVVGALSVAFVLGVAHLMIAFLLMTYNNITPYA